MHLADLIADVAMRTGATGDRTHEQVNADTVDAVVEALAERGLLTAVDMTDGADPDPGPEDVFLIRAGHGDPVPGWRLTVEHLVEPDGTTSYWWELWDGDERVAEPGSSLVWPTRAAAAVQGQAITGLTVEPEQVRRG